MRESDNNFWRSIILVIGLVSVLWVVQILQMMHIYDFTIFANHPRHLDGLKGIIFSPFVHDSEKLDHLISNTLPILVLLTALINAYPRVALFALVFIHIGSGLLVWLFAPSDTLHIGISGIIYGIAAFLIASGIFRRDRNSIAIALFVTLVYGGMIAGFLPERGLSWQSHLFGAITGIISAYMFRKVDLPEPVQHDLSSTHSEGHFFDSDTTS